MKLLKTSLVLILSILCFSCSDDDNETPPTVINEEEVITTVELSITDTESGKTEIISWVADKNDSSNPEIKLAANKSYETAVRFLNASNPEDVEDITKEVVEEKDEHFIFFTASETLKGFTVTSNLDKDTIDSNTVGINVETNWTTVDAGTGKLTVFLIHEPTTKEGTTRNAFGGATDVEVTFNVVIE